MNSADTRVIASYGQTCAKFKTQFIHARRQYSTDTGVSVGLCLWKPLMPSRTTSEPFNLRIERQFCPLSIYVILNVPIQSSPQDSISSESIRPPMNFPRPCLQIIHQTSRHQRIKDQVDSVDYWFSRGRLTVPVRLVVSHCIRRHTKTSDSEEQSHDNARQQPCNFDERIC